MFFKKKQKQPLEEAVEMIAQAIEVAYTYKRDKHFQPTTENLKLLHDLEQKVFGMYATLGYISRCLEQRFNGEPEGAKKFTDSEVFDYHYPP